MKNETKVSCCAELVWCCSRLSLKLSTEVLVRDTYSTCTRPTCSPILAVSYLRRLAGPCPPPLDKAHHPWWGAQHPSTRPTIPGGFGVVRPVACRSCAMGI
eukprot:6306-Pelagococcus_subviridis.AAC.4